MQIDKFATRPPGSEGCPMAGMIRIIYVLRIITARAWLGRLIADFWGLVNVFNLSESLIIKCMFWLNCTDESISVWQLANLVYSAPRAWGLMGTDVHSTVWAWGGAASQSCKWASLFPALIPLFRERPPAPQQGLHFQAAFQARTWLSVWNPGTSNSPCAFAGGGHGSYWHVYSIKQNIR